MLAELLRKGRDERLEFFLSHRRNRVIAMKALSKKGVRLTKRVEEREQTLIEEARKAGKKFLGRKQVLRQHPKDSPDSPAKRRTLSPRLATGDRRALNQAKAELVAFYRAYRDAWQSYADGLGPVAFSYGTYLMCYRHHSPQGLAGG